MYQDAPKALFCGSLPFLLHLLLLLLFLPYLPAPPLETGAYADSAHTHTHTHTKFSLCQILHHQSFIHLGGVFGMNMSSVSAITHTHFHTRLWPFLFDANLLCHCAGLIRSPSPSQLLFCRDCFPFFPFISLLPRVVLSSFCCLFPFILSSSSFACLPLSPPFLLLLLSLAFSPH